MKRIDPNKMSKTEWDRLGAEAETIEYQNTRPLSPAARRALSRAAGKGGRPRVGAKRINITVEKSLLAKTDAFARIHGLTRAAVISAGLRRIVA